MEELPLLVMLTTKKQYEKSEMVPDDQKKDYYIIKRYEPGTERQKIDAGTFKNALERMLDGVNVNVLNAEQKEIYSTVKNWMEEDESESVTTGNQVNKLMQLLCYDVEDNLIKPEGVSTNYALLTYQVKPYISRAELSEPVDVLEIRADFRSMVAHYLNSS